MTDTLDRPSTSAPSWESLAQRLSSSLHLSVAPIAISFGASRPSGVAEFDAPMSEPTVDGRSGRVPAGCVFWVKAPERTFSTVPEDHGNCSVGSFTHGMVGFDDIAGNADVATLLDVGWVTPDAVGGIPQVSERPGAVTYGPLAEVPGAPGDTAPGRAPDVVLLRVNGRQMMVLSDAVEGLRIEGKPQCHIVALAKEHGEVAASVGCALSRARTGMRPDEMTCAVPGSRLVEVVDAVERTASVDTVVAKYAAEDARRFA